MAETPSGPLAGVRVVELAGIGPGPFAAMLLADLGADVVRVDRPGGAGLAIDPAYDVTNRNKRSVLVDLKAEDGRGAAAVLALAERADILIEGYRPQVAERLGVGPGDCLARNPRLVYGRMTGWGQDGPLAQRAGHDISYIAVTGALGMIGRPEEAPAVPANLLGDYAGGSLYLVIGVLAGLQHARATGEGQVVDAAIVDGTAHLTAMIHGMMAAGGWQDRRGSNLLDGACPFYGTYETADGEYMAVGALEKQFYAEFTERLGLGDLADARAHLADHINRAEQGTPTVITRNGVPVAAVVPIEDFEALEEAADVLLARGAEAVLAEGGPTVTMAELLADLFAEGTEESA
ncbi:CaiB/BaiF CoA-transferase family protein [Streptomyces sp. GC420]|uniref:CaiB/BaiF CoA transferase family protein n=1 Tax=Streptomyces sp. GC420 TaxID=2697568 RepID=UPI0014151D71|nr:CaiB/BaiF CoA-transferase family protein [Streptomyces sp. GC420]NBM17960.1 type II toxin-antitoxin system prevent-host-death family antitoxin [Streptomyces sp. GC420]